jgi:hypothetical protein
MKAPLLIETWDDKTDILKLALCWALTLTTSTLLTVRRPSPRHHRRSSNVVITLSYIALNCSQDHRAPSSEGEWSVRLPSCLHHRNVSFRRGGFICTRGNPLHQIRTARWLQSGLLVSGGWCRDGHSGDGAGKRRCAVRLVFLHRAWTSE